MMMLSPVVFCPIHDYSILYVEETDTKRFSVAFVLPISYYSNDYHLRVGDGSNALEINAAWPAKTLAKSYFTRPKTG